MDEPARDARRERPAGPGGPGGPDESDEPDTSGVPSTSGVPNKSDEPEQPDQVDELVMRCLPRVEREGPAAIDAICREHPEHAAALRSRLRTLLDAGLLVEPDAPPERLGEFRLLRRLGGGGMGVVYAAVQESLGREVALKIVRSDQLYFPGARERFRREVQLVARLAHAGIVPVYTVGEEQGVPFFAMEKLQGATLAEALAALDGPPGRGRDLAAAVARVVEQRDGARVEVGGELYAGSGTEACARIVQRVAEALAHAHGRGVLHRDLKPSNVMLTSDGRALLFDFGLASSADSARLTKSGSRVGSLAYMAPEQVRGGEVDERTDVYGLGAVLCEALTLRPPHVGAPEAVAAAILRGEPVDVRERRRDVPRDAVTIVETALAPDPARRYGGAAALARDLGSFLSRRPIVARPAGPLLRAARWIQRHPARAALAALVVVGPLLLAVQQLTARRRVSEQQERAEANLDRSLEVLRDFWSLGAGVLQHVPHFDERRIELLEEAAASVERLLSQRPGDASMAALSVQLNASLGYSYTTLGRLTDAETRFGAAIADGATEGLDAAETIPALNGLGIVREKRGDVQGARDLFREALGRLGGASHHEAHVVANAVQRNVARVERRLGRWTEAVAAADAAIAAAERALEQAADEDERLAARHALGAALNQRAVPRSGLPGAEQDTRDARARDAWSAALEILRALAASRPDRSDIVHDAAATCVNAASYRGPAEAEVVLREGLELVAPLRARFPRRAEYVVTEAGLLNGLGLVLVQSGRPAEAREHFERAGAELEPWLGQGDDDATLLVQRARIDANLAMSLVQLGERAAACDPAARAAARFERAWADMPPSEDLRRELAWTRIQEGYGRLARGEAERARALADAVPVEELADDRIAVAVGELVAGCADLASDPEEADRLREEALDLLQRGIELGFTAVEYLRTTPDWASLRGTPRFEELVAGVSG